MQAQLLRGLRIFLERRHFTIDADILGRRHFAIDADILGRRHFRVKYYFV